MSEHALLLIVDIQERLVAAMEDQRRVINNTLHLIELAKLHNIPILLTEQYPEGIGPTVEEIRVALPVYDPHKKVEFSCCKSGGFNAKIKAHDRATVILCGIEAHVCVLQTCTDLLSAGYNVHVVRDAVSSRTIENKETGILYMRDAGAVVTTTEIVIFQTLVQAATDKFKVMAKRIK